MMKSQAKKAVAFALAGAMALMMAGCGSKGTSGTADVQAKGEGVMDYAAYAAAADDTAVTIETFVQGKQALWTNPDTGVSTASLYTEDANGGYFIYRMEMTPEDYERMVPGTKLRIEGTKTSWSGEAEIAEGTGKYTFEDGTYVATPVDLTESFADIDKLLTYQNRSVSFSDLQVAARSDGSVYNYKWDGSGDEGDDLYFTVTSGDTSYDFVVESDLCGTDSAVYQAVKGLAVGDTINVEGFLYWYEGPQMHVTSVSVSKGR